MKTNKLREKLNNGEPTLSTHIHSTWPSVVEAIGHTGLYDYVEFVAEYGSFGLHDLDNLCRATELFDMGSMIKVDRSAQEFLAQRGIGAGFSSVLFTDTRSADDVRECIRIARPDTPEDNGLYGVATRRNTYMGYGGNRDKIGPEFGFGLSMAQKLDAPILIIKTSWGGKSLNYNFRPPSAGPYKLNEKEQTAKNAADISKNASLNWRMMNEAVHNVLKDLKTHHPAYDAKVGYDIAGFVWFQGFNDQFSDEFRNNYRDNMVHFVKDVRKEYKTPKMPFVIGVLGTNMSKEGVDKNAVSVAQREAAAAQEFKGNVASVESYKVYDLEARKVYDSGWAKHFAEWCVVGSDRPYHYLGSGKFFVRLGDSFANAMIGLINNQANPGSGKITIDP